MKETRTYRPSKYDDVWRLEAEFPNSVLNYNINCILFSFWEWLSLNIWLTWFNKNFIIAKIYESFRMPAVAAEPSAELFLISFSVASAEPPRALSSALLLPSLTSVPGLGVWPDCWVSVDWFLPPPQAQTKKQK